MLLYFNLVKKLIVNFNSLETPKNNLTKLSQAVNCDGKMVFRWKQWKKIIDCPLLYFEYDIISEFALA